MTSTLASGIVFLGFIWLSLLPRPVDAQTVDLAPRPNEGSEWSLGATVISAPRYFGSDERRVRAFPAVVARSADGWFISGRADIGWDFSSTRDHLEYGVMVSPQLPRYESDAAALRGMGDIALRAEAGAFVNYSPTRELSLKAALRYGAGNDNRGAVLSAAVGTGYPVSAKTFLGASLGVSFINQNYAQSYFGVDTAQSARSGYAPYAPRGGLADVNLGVALAGQISPQWNYALGVNAARLLRDARNSPLTRSATQTVLFSGVTYKFK